MGRRIYKWQAESHLGGDSIGRFPAGKVLLVAAQNPNDTLPTLWIEHTAPSPDGEYEEYVLKGTGRLIASEGLEHVGSCLCANGALVWHIYKVRR